MAQPPHSITIGELAARTGIATSAIRFYESKGLITPRRTTSGQRRFAPSDVRRISFILITQQLGFSLATITGHLEAMPEGRPPTRRDWERLSRGFHGELEERIRGLEALRDRLSSCIGCGCLSLKACAIYNPGDVAAEAGPGPRFLMGDPAPADGEPTARGCSSRSRTLQNDSRD